MKILRITKKEVLLLRTYISEKKTELKKKNESCTALKKKAAMLGFAKMFGKFLPEYTNIRIGQV